MRYFTFLIFFVFATGCASNKTVYISGAENSDSTAKLTSVCTESCESALRNKFTFFKAKLAKSVSPALLNQVNSVRGDGSMFCSDCRDRSHTDSVFNHWLDGMFSVVVPSGQTSILASPNDVTLANSKLVPIKFDAQAGHSYFVGYISNKAVTDHWSIVLVNVTEGRVLYPTERPW